MRSSSKRLSRRELRRLGAVYEEAESQYLGQVRLWLAGERSVAGLQDLRESAEDFRMAVEMLRFKELMA